MARLIIKREKAILGCALAMNCYVGDTVICRVENGKEEVCDVADGVIAFSCGLPFNKRSDVLYIDVAQKKEIRIVVKQSGAKPEAWVINPVMTGESKPQAEKGFCKRRESEKEKFFPTKKVGSYFGINEETRQWAVSKGLFSTLENGAVYRYEDIVDFELLEDGTSVVKGGLGRAVAGGFMFGGVGAVVGGITGGKRAHQKCTSLRIKITVSQLAAPVVYISLISTETAKDSRAYRKAYQDAQEIISLLQVICSSVEKTQQAERSMFSSADELRKWKQLLDEGVITQEEFELKKKRLLEEER